MRGRTIAVVGLISGLLTILLFAGGRLESRASSAKPKYAPPAETPDSLRAALRKVEARLAAYRQAIQQLTEGKISLEQVARTADALRIS
jgi:hypothetical protein